LRYKGFAKGVVCGFLTFTLLATSFGGAYANSVLAAKVDAAEIGVIEEPKAASNKTLMGLAALGLIAVFAGNKDKKQDSAPSGSTAGVAEALRVNVKPTQAEPTPVIVKKSNSTPTQSPSSQIKSAEQRAFDLLNADRRANGLPTLKMNGSLVVLAENYGEDMIKRNYFSHYNPEGQSPFDRMRNYGISYRYAGENLAINNSVDAAERALMNSPGHRANILNPNYTEVGVGVNYDSRGSVYVVQEFIGR
jgi:uncharacterized protein YkwD